MVLSCAPAVEEIARSPWKLGEDHPAARSAKVVEVFRYLEQHPARLSGTEMGYEPSDIMARRKGRSFLDTPALSLTPEDMPTSAPGDYAKLACAALQLACGGLDECHNIVTPLSWDAPTLFGGAPVESEARSEATLLHHLVHLREGQHVGEFGTGWNNSGFWAGALGEHPVLSQAHVAALLLARDSDRLERCMAADHPDGKLVPRRFLGLCLAAQRDGDAELVGFCEGVENAMLRLAFEEAFARV